MRQVCALSCFSDADQSAVNPTKVLWLMALALSLAACPGKSTTAPPDPRSRPTAVASRSFGDPPVQGQLMLVPAADGSIWDYRVDLDADGSVDRSGTLDGPVELDYSLIASGVHRLLITFSGSRGFVPDTAFVIVNDPSVATLRNHRGPPELSNTLRGIAFAGGFLYTTNGSAVERRDPVTLETVATTVVLDSPAKSLQGLAVSPEGLLYAINRQRPEVLEFSILALQHLRTLRSSFVADFFIDARLSGRLHAGGGEGLAIVDLQQNALVVERRFIAGFHFALGPRSRTVALAQKGSEPRVRLLSAETLEDVWEFPMGDVSPELLAFSGREDVIYVLGLDSGNNVMFLALDRVTGSPIRNVTLEPCQSPSHCFRLVESNPVLTLDDFTVMTSANGAYLIFHDSHLPLYRIGSTAPPIVTCCNVARGPDTRSLYFSGHDGSLTSVVLAF